MRMPNRTTLTTAGASLWAVVGGSVSLAGLTSVNDDAMLLVGLFSILGPALAMAAAVAAGRGSLRNSGLLLVMSALTTPTYFAYPLNVVALGAGLWLAVTARSAAPGRGAPCDRLRVALGPDGHPPGVAAEQHGDVGQTL